jgi:hypothetical protein
MLKTFDAPFDFHAPEGGRPRFAEFALTLSENFDATPQIIDDPIFSYARGGRSQLDRLRELDESRPAIVYLSNVVMHSALLILGDCDISGLTSPFCYDSIESFRTGPFSRGFGIGRRTKVTTGFDDTTVVICDLARFRNEDDELPDDGLFRVLDSIEDVYVCNILYACNILDYGRYFAHPAVLFGEGTFFLNADSNVDFHESIKQLRNETLREYLLGQSIPFATLGDDHMDDQYAVSYGTDCWRFSDDELAFAR